MRTTYKSFFLIIFFIIIAGCDENSDNHQQLIISGELTSISPCKHTLKSTNQFSETPANQSCVEYVYDNSENSLSIKHINAGFNCCLDSAYCTIELKGDTIVIQEAEVSAFCDCNCLYDLDVKVKGVEQKSYEIKFIEPLSGGQDALQFSIDLISSPEGSFCVTRDGYPWGIIGFSE